jgi:PleD family two-component response regulator
MHGEDTGMPKVKEKLLIVDDKVSIRMSLAQIFMASGYIVRAGEDSFSALSETQQEIPDILLSNLYMPRKSGFELLSVVRSRFPQSRNLDQVTWLNAHGTKKHGHDSLPSLGEVS